MNVGRLSVVGVEDKDLRLYVSESKMAAMEFFDSAWTSFKNRSWVMGILEVL